MHFYDKEGKPAYEVPNKSAGGMRPTTITDARKNGYVPSVTTIMALLDKPMIKHWERTQLLEALGNMDWMSAGSIQELLRDADKEVEKKKGNKRGTEIHDKLEWYFNTGIMDEEDKNILNPAVGILEMVLPTENNISVRQAAISERSFYDLEGFGGKVDLCSSQNLFIVDFKTKAKDKLLEKDLIYDDHLMQLAAYRKGLDMPTARCYNLFISTTKPGEVLLVEHKEEELQRGWEMFSLLLKFWRLKHNV